MTTFKFTCNWQAIGNDAPEHGFTMADIALFVDNKNLMENENIWSKTIHKSALLSAYPLALWIASSWWRLNWEPLPARGTMPSVDWRLAHELGAADHGYVWPKVVFAPDGNVMQVWAGLMNNTEGQSLRYLNSLETTAFLGLDDFRREAADFINTVINRLSANDFPENDLANLWNLIQLDSSEQQSMRYRQLEAMMGFDPDECEEERVSKAVDLEKWIGEDTIVELIPIYGRTKPLEDIESLSGTRGLSGIPQTPTLTPSRQRIPWQRAVENARLLRNEIGNVEKQMTDTDLCGLLGLKTSDVENWSPSKRHEAALAVPEPGKKYNFIPRKKHPLAKRFELARFIGDYIQAAKTDGRWLASTDLDTSRQKYQRAFAAEFLCPIKALQEFLKDDFSDSAIDDAVEHFQVSEKTVKSLLFNNQLIPFDPIFNYSSERLPWYLSV